MASLEAILNQLKPEALAPQLKLHDLAREHISPRRFEVETEEEFMNEVERYILHHKKFVGEKIKKEGALSIGTAIIEQDFEGGIKTAIIYCKLGLEGGLKRVYDFLQEGQRGQAEDELMMYVIKTNIPLEYQKRVGLAKQFIERSRRLLHPGETPISAQELAPVIDKVILKYVRESSKFSLPLRGL